MIARIAGSEAVAKIWDLKFTANHSLHQSHNVQNLVLNSQKGGRRQELKLFDTVISQESQISSVQESAHS